MSNYNNRNNKPKEQDGRAYHNRALESGFASLRDKIKTTSYRRVDNHQPNYSKMPAVNNLKEDGVDHINLHHHAETGLGKALSVYGDYEFTHNKYGRFRTVHGLMSYLAHSSQPDEFRTLNGFGVQNARKAMFEPDTFVPEYQWLVIDATWQKIKSYPKLARELYECNKPFDFYYLQTTDPNSNTTIRVRMFETYEWMNQGLLELRNALREGREPDLMFLLSQEGRRKALNEQERQRKLQADRTREVEIEKAHAKKLELEKKELQDKKDLECVYRTMNNAAIGIEPEDANLRPLTKTGDILYVRDKAVRHNRRLFINYRSVGKLIKDFKDTDIAVWVELIKKALSSNYKHISRMGIVIDKGTHLNKTDTFETYSIFEVAYGDVRSNVDVQFLAIPTSSSVMHILTSSICEGTTKYSTYILEALGGIEVTVNVKEESVDCGAQVPEFKSEYIPDGIAELDFAPVLGSDVVQYRVHSADAIEFDPTELGNDAITDCIQDMEAIFENEVRHHRKRASKIETLGYILAVDELVNGKYNAYDIKRVTFTNDAGNPITFVDLLWYHGDDSVRIYSATKPGIDQPTVTDEVGNILPDPVIKVTVGDVLAQFVADVPVPDGFVDKVLQTVTDKVTTADMSVPDEFVEDAVQQAVIDGGSAAE